MGFMFSTQNRVGISTAVGICPFFLLVGADIKRGKIALNNWKLIDALGAERVPKLGMKEATCWPLLLQCGTQHSHAKRLHGDLLQLGPVFAIDQLLLNHGFVIFGQPCVLQQIDLFELGCHNERLGSLLENDLRTNLVVFLVDFFVDGKGEQDFL